MRTFRFTVILANIDIMTEQLANDLFAAGCDDALPASGCGIASVAFDREAESLESAIASAIADVETAGVAVQRVELDHDEIAELRQ